MKLVIIEDRMRRLRDFQDFDINKTINALIITGIPFSDLLIELGAGNPASLDAFEVIAAHRSALNNKDRDVLKQYCLSKKKPLVFFSGGITSSIYKDSEFPFLYLNSKDFYSINLKIFLEHLKVCAVPNLLILQFGMKWKMSLLLGLRNRIVVAQSKSIMITGGSDIKIIELIRRVQDLQISELIKKDLVTNQTREILSGSPTASVTNQNLIEIKAVIDQQIISML